MSQSRIITIYSSEGLVLQTLPVRQNTHEIVFPLPAPDGSGQLVIQIDARGRVFFPLHRRTVCLGHA